MAQKYVIRQNAFHYSDEYLYFQLMGVVVGDVFNDYHEAHSALMDLEREAYLQTDLGDVEPFSRCSSGVGMQIKHYFEKELRLEILKTNERGHISAETGTFLPQTITNEQIDKIRSLSGLKFYELITFEDEPQFFGIWENSPFYRHSGFIGVDDSVYFYNSYIEAYNEAPKTSPNETKIKGKLEDITDMPVILKTLISNSNSISYDEVEEVLTIKKAQNEEWASLCTLLKNKPFEIRLLSLEDVQNYEQDAYESM